MSLKIVGLLFLAACVSTPMKQDLPEKILLIGDSHSDYQDEGGVFGYFGIQMQKLLPGLSVVSASGSNPMWFVNGRSDTHLGCTISLPPKANYACSALPKLETIIAPFTTVMIEQGANMVGASSADIKAATHALLKVVGTRKCYWVGKPPARVTSTSEELRIESLLKSNVSPCKYISSRFFTFEDGPFKDGEHLSKAVAIKWAEGIVGGIK